MHTEHNYNHNHNLPSSSDHEALQQLRLSLLLNPRPAPTIATSPPPTLRRISSPSAILEDNSLYLGTLSTATDDHLLYKLRITHILSLLSPSTPLTIPGSRTHHRINLLDTPESDLLSILPAATSWIDQVLADKNAVLMVHCQKGVSRSAAVVVGWLMMKRRWSLGHTLDWVKKRRGVRPNDGFLRQLAVWEERIFGEGNLLADVSSKM